MRGLNAVSTGILAVSLSVAGADAQSGELRATLAQARVVEVRSTFRDSEGTAERPIVGAGTILGHRTDTLFVVTTKHQVDGAFAVEVRLAPTSPLLRGDVRTIYEGADMAIVAVGNLSAINGWSLPSAVPRDPKASIVGWAALLGCPDDICWSTPQPAEIIGSREEIVVFRTHYVKGGASGGPLVDLNGAVIGLVLGEREGDGQAIWWPFVEHNAIRAGYPANLQPVRGYGLGEVSIRLFGAAWPRAGINTDGRRLLPGGRLEVAVRVASRMEIAGGASRISFAASPYANRKAAYEEAYVHSYLFLGWRYSRPLTAWSVGRVMPDVASAGADILYPISNDTDVVGMAPSDSVDLATGEYVSTRSVIPSRAGIAISFRSSYRVSVTKHFGIILATALYAPQFSYLESTPLRGFVEIGADARIP